MPSPREVDYNIEDLIPQHKPKWMVDDDNNVWCDGVKVERWQMTPEEIRAFLPRIYEEIYPQKDMPCLLPDCKDAIAAGGKTGFMAHARNKHVDWYAERRKRLLDAPDLEAIRAIIREEIDVQSQ